MSILGRIRKHREDVAFSDDEWLRADAVRWEPLNYGITRTLRGRAADMDDDGQVGATAWETIFTSPDSPGAKIAVCAYPSFMESEGTYWAGFRFTYTCDDAPGWSYAGYEKDPQDQAWDNFIVAEMAAEALAVLVGADPAWATATMPVIFEWDGRRFDPVIRDSDGAP